MNNSVQFQEEKKVQISKLKKQNDFLEELKKGNNQSNILNETQFKEIEDILDQNKKYLKKIETNEFEIAIVGLEKAGKSTFANALIENEILPSAPERCTFTSTRLISGNDSATIEFYNKEEFNEIFIELLREIKYPSDGVNYENLDLHEFKKYFDKLGETDVSLHKNHIGKTDEEVCDILNSRSKLTLNGEIIKFSGDDLLSSDFQSYIKGEDHDTSKPRSVKKIEIQSSKLQQLQTAVIYDVPGFDSPTQIHERQTLERLKEADAIILVTNVGRNPSIQGTTLKIINNNTDSDGIPLKDKLFVFGNQLDTANSTEEAQGNTEILSNDVEKYQIGEKKRVFVGSALKHLIEKGVTEKEYNSTVDVSSGINEIRDELINYYENERFEIIKRKIDVNKKKLQELFKDVLQNVDFGNSENFAEDERGKITRVAYKDIECALDNALTTFKSELKNEIWEEEYFSNKFRNEIEEGNYFVEVTPEMIRKSSISQDDSITRDVPVEKINQSIRTGLHKDFLSEFSILIQNITDNKSKDIEVNLLRTFTNAVLINSSPVKYDEVEIHCEKFIQDVTSEIAHDKGRFIYLIERFSRDVFDILISYPLLSEDRHTKFIEAKKEFNYLDNFYKKGRGSLIRLILIGHDKKDFLGGFNKLDLTIKLAKFAGGLTTSFGSSSKVVEQAQKAVKYLQSSNEEQAITDVKELVEGEKRSTTEAEILEEINRDINNLRSILKEAVVPAANLEQPFLNSVDKQIKLLISSFQNHHSKNSNKFDSFISRVVPIIKENELNSINSKVEARKLMQEHLQKMKELKL